MSKLVLRNVGKRYGSFDAVSDFSLALAAGEFVSLLGPSDFLEHPPSSHGNAHIMAKHRVWSVPMINRLPGQRSTFRLSAAFPENAVGT